jgi:hypothetical protein
LAEVSMLTVSIDPHRARIGERFSVSFQRTLRIPDDSRVYPLPPGLGALPIQRVEDYGERVPTTWRESGGVFIPMRQGEALWLGFDGATWRPNAVKVGVGQINAISGGRWDRHLRDAPQDYLVCPDQPWLDGINAGDGFIRQFVAMPLGLGYTVEAQISGREEFGGIQVLLFEPKPGRFPDRPPAEPKRGPELQALHAASPAGEMGLGVGGRMRQKIYPDPYGLETWDPESYGCLVVHIVNSEQYRELTGLEPPPTPISPQTYARYGLPWFDLYDEEAGDLTAPERLAKVRSVREQDAERGILAHVDDASLEVPETDVEKLHRPHGQDGGT